MHLPTYIHQDFWKVQYFLSDGEIILLLVLGYMMHVHE